MKYPKNITICKLNQNKTTACRISKLFQGGVSIWSSHISIINLIKDWIILPNLNCLLSLRFAICHAKTFFLLYNLSLIWKHSSVHNLRTQFAPPKNWGTKPSKICKYFVAIYIGRQSKTIQPLSWFAFNWKLSMKKYFGTLQQAHLHIWLWIVIFRSKSFRFTSILNELSPNYKKLKYHLWLCI